LARRQLTLDNTVAAELAASPPADTSSALKDVAMTLIRTVGGAAGPLYGTFFLRASTACAGLGELGPAEWLADGGFARNADIEDAHRRDTTVYAPVRHPRNSSRDPHVALPDDSEAIIQWRQRMGSKAAKEIYKQRAATAECVNAIARGRGLTQFLVRGLNKVKAVALWYALAHNLMRAVTLVQPA